MISSIEITRFRGIREGKLEDLTPLVVLVGPNGCGKSTVLDAMLIGASPQPGLAIGRVVVRHKGVPRGADWLFYRAERANAEVRAETSAGKVRKCRLARYPVMDENRPKVGCFLLPGKRKVEVLFDVAGHFDVSGNGEFALEGVADVRLVEFWGDEIQTPLDELYSRITLMGLRDEAKSLFAAVVPGLKGLEILTAAGRPVLYFVCQKGPVPAALAGDGIQALVRLALELASFPDGMVLLEEPEVHQHPAAIRQTVRAILAAVRRDIQVVLTTHSLELIDSLIAEAGPDDLEKTSLYRLHLKDGALGSVRLSGSEIAFARGTIDEDLR